LKLHTLQNQHTKEAKNDDFVSLTIGTGYVWNSGYIVLIVILLTKRFAQGYCNYEILHLYTV